MQRAGGFSGDELAALREDPRQAPLEEAQKALLLFVLKVVKTPEDVDEADMAGLHKLGWSDQEIFDAAFHGASMAGPSMLYKAFAR